MALKRVVVLTALLLLGLASRAAIAQDEVQRLLALSGAADLLAGLPALGMARARAAASRLTPAPSDAELDQLERSVRDAYHAEAFLEQGQKALAAAPPAKLQQALAAVSLPLARRMTELESLSPKESERTAFQEQSRAASPSAVRAGLLREIDLATRTTDLLLGVTLSTLKGYLLARAGACAETHSAERELAAVGAAEEVRLREAVQANLAFVYRNVAEDELRQYAKLQQGAAAHWVLEQVFAAAQEELHAASARLAADRRLGAPGAARACAPKERAAPRRHGQRHRAAADSRRCLDQATSAQVAACAARYP